MKTAHLREGIMQAVFTACACISILAVVLICVFLFANGLPTIGKIGPLKFLLGTTWKPGNDIYGILPMILGSIYITAGAVVIGVPVGFVNVVESKRHLVEICTQYGVPAIAAMGRKGGSNVAAAICNALIYSAAEMLDPHARGWQ